MIMIVIKDNDSDYDCDNSFVLCVVLYWLIRGYDFICFVFLYFIRLDRWWLVLFDYYCNV